MASGLLQSISDLMAGGLLKGYDAIVDRQNLPSNQRVYLNTVLDKNVEPITNKDFTEKELATIKSLIERKGGDSGSIKYSDYPKPKEGESMLARPLSGAKFPYENIKTTLGQFTYKLDPKTGQYVVSDVYDFNAAPLDKNASHGDYIGKFFLSPYVIARAYGQNVVPEGSGRQVRVMIPGLISKQDTLKVLQNGNKRNQ